MAAALVLDTLPLIVKVLWHDGMLGSLWLDKREFTKDISYISLFICINQSRDRASERSVSFSPCTGRFFVLCSLVTKRCQKPFQFLSLSYYMFIARFKKTYRPFHLNIQLGKKGARRPGTPWPTDGLFWAFFGYRKIQWSLMHVSEQQNFAKCQKCWKNLFIYVATSKFWMRKPMGQKKFIFVTHKENYYCKYVPRRASEHTFQN